MIQLYTKKDIAQLMNLSYKTLRVYEEKGLITPSYINPQNGYKYYDEYSIYTVAMIRYSNIDLDIPLDEIKEVLDTPDHQSDLITLLEEKKKQAESMVQKYQQIIENIEHSLAFNTNLKSPNTPFREHIQNTLYYIPLKSVEDNLNLWAIAQKIYSPIGHKHFDFLLQFDDNFSPYFTKIGVFYELPNTIDYIEIFQENIDAEFLCISFKDYDSHPDVLCYLEEYALEHNITLDKSCSFLDLHSLDVSTLTLENTIMTLRIKIVS